MNRHWLGLGEGPEFMPRREALRRSGAGFASMALAGLLGEEDDAAAHVAQLHLFGGLPVTEAGAALRLSRAMAYRNWKYARAWLREALKK